MRMGGPPPYLVPMQQRNKHKPDVSFGRHGSLSGVTTNIIWRAAHSTGVTTSAFQASSRSVATSAMQCWCAVHRRPSLAIGCLTPSEELSYVSSVVADLRDSAISAWSRARQPCI